MPLGPRCPTGKYHEYHGSFTLYVKENRTMHSKAVFCPKCRGIWFKTKDGWDFYRVDPETRIPLGSHLPPSDVSGS